MEEIEIQLTVNGVQRTVRSAPYRTLLQVLRDARVFRFAHPIPAPVPLVPSAQSHIAPCAPQIGTTTPS